MNNFIKKIGFAFIIFNILIVGTIKAGLKEDVEHLSQQIRNIRSTSFGFKAVENLKKASNDFDKLKYDDSNWEEIIKTESYYPWRSQTPKDIVGGHIFFPSKVGNFHFEDLKEEKLLEVFLQRSDILWSLCISARYGNPLGKYYLAGMLEDYYSEYAEETQEFPKFLSSLYNQSMPEIDNAGEKNNPQALYLLAHEHSFINIRRGFLLNPEKAKKCYEKLISAEVQGKDMLPKQQGRASLFLLELERLKGHSKPTEKDYLEIGRKYKFGPAIRYAALFSKEKSSKEKYFVEAASDSYEDIFSYVILGLYHQCKNKNDEVAKQYFTKAVEAGVTEGHIRLAHLITGDISKNPQYFNKLASEYKKREPLMEKIMPAENSLKEAVNKGHMLGWYHLSSLYEAVYDLYGDNRDLQKVRATVEKGLELGSESAYSWLLTSLKDESLLKKYGEAPQSHKFLEQFKIFIENKN